MKKTTVFMRDSIKTIIVRKLPDFLTHLVKRSGPFFFDDCLERIDDARIVSLISWASVPMQSNLQLHPSFYQP